MTERDAFIRGIVIGLMAISLGGGMVFAVLGAYRLAIERYPTGVLFIAVAVQLWVLAWILAWAWEDPGSPQEKG